MTYIISAVALLLAIFGAIFQSTIIIYALIALTIVILALVVFGKLKASAVLVFSFSLAFLYQTSLMTTDVVGTDIHSEYFYAWQTYINGYWNTSITHAYNTSVGISLFVPLLAKLMSVDVAWVFKIVCPIFAAGAVTVFYRIIKRYWNAKIAFISAFVIIYIPTYILEVPGVAKTELGLLFMALCLLAVVAQGINNKLRGLLIVILTTLTMMMHYSLGFVLLAYLIAIVAILGFAKLLFKAKSNTGVLSVALPIVAIVLIGGLYFYNVAGSSVWRAVAGTYTGQVQSVENAINNQASVSPITNNETKPRKSGISIYLNNGEQLIRTAFGFDFRDTTALGKVFRVLQFLIQALLLIGTIWFIKNWRKFKIEYVALVGAGVMMLGASAFVPGASSILNASRFYLLAMLILSPVMIQGGILIFRNYKILALGLFIPYFAFTSGAIYEITKSTDTHTINIPYSYALSASRLDMTGLYTQNDMAVRDWIISHDIKPVFGDLWSVYLILEKKGDISSDMLFFPPEYRSIPSTKDKAAYYLSSEIKDVDYIFVREWNEQHQQITGYDGIGQRDNRDYSTLNLSAIFKERPIIYQAGMAKLYGAKTT